MSDVVERARAALEGVTDGPWVALGDAVGNEVQHCTCGGPSEPYGHEQFCGVEGPVVRGVDPIDGKFIAEARSLVPELIAEVECLSAQLKRMAATR